MDAWKRVGRLIALLGLAVLAVCAPAQEPNVEEILRHLDALYRSRTSHGRLEMTIITPHWERTMELEIWTEGMEKTLILIHAPKKDAGTATLRIGSEMWNYFPKIDKVMKVPPSMMGASWMGSDFTNDDLVRETSYQEDYTARLLPSEDPETYAIELVPHQDTPTVWGRIVMTVRRSDWIPVRFDFYDERGNRTRELRFSEVRTLGGRTIPTVMEVVPLTKEGHRTVVRYLEAAFDIELPRDLFSLRSLRRG
ncbi:MAG: outer membrane lipoprotein-sorting protein [Candidatus Poribacteria bacterium]|nr:MAG: outer membrane lipoprotein-sorting protein [Candidatus Poribacteria bacterium]